MQTHIQLYRHQSTRQLVMLFDLKEEIRKEIEEGLIEQTVKQKKEWENRSLYERILSTSTLRSSAWIFSAWINQQHKSVFQVLQRVSFQALQDAKLIPFVMDEEKTDEKELKKYDIRIYSYHDILEEDEEGPETYISNLHDQIHLDWMERRGDHYLQGYVCLLSIKQKNLPSSGGVTYYPHYREETEITSAITSLLFQCGIPNKELHIPFKQGTLLVMSGSTFWKLNPLKGKEDAYTVVVHVLLRE